MYDHFYHHLINHFLHLEHHIELLPYLQCRKCFIKVTLSYIIYLNCFFSSHCNIWCYLILLWHWQKQDLILKCNFLLTIFLLVSGTFPLPVCTIIKLGHRIPYGKCEEVNTIRLSFMEFSDFQPVSSHITCLNYIIYIHYHLCIIFSVIFS